MRDGEQSDGGENGPGIGVPVEAGDGVGLAPDRGGQAEDGDSDGDRGETSGGGKSA